MSNVLTQTIVYVILLFAGYGFKKAGIFKVEDTDFLKKVILYLTMPAMAKLESMATNPCQLV